MSKGDTFEGNWLDLIFLGTAISNLADNASISPLTDLYVALHTASPTDSGSQLTSEATYTSYARVAVARSGSGWSRSGNVITPVAAITFPTATGGSETITHFSVGTTLASAGVLLYYGTVTPNIVVTSSVTPELAATTQISED